MVENDNKKTNSIKPRIRLQQVRDQSKIIFNNIQNNVKKDTQTQYEKFSVENLKKYQTEKLTELYQQRSQYNECFGEAHKSAAMDCDDKNMFEEQRKINEKKIYERSKAAKQFLKQQKELQAKEVEKQFEIKKRINEFIKTLEKKSMQYKKPEKNNQTKTVVTDSININAESNLKKSSQYPKIKYFNSPSSKHFKNKSKQGLTPNDSKKNEINNSPLSSPNNKNKKKIISSKKRAYITTNPNKKTNLNQHQKNINIVNSNITRNKSPEKNNLKEDAEELNKNNFMYRNTKKTTMSLTGKQHITDDSIKKKEKQSKCSSPKSLKKTFSPKKIQKKITQEDKNKKKTISPKNRSYLSNNSDSESNNKLLKCENSCKLHNKKKICEYRRLKRKTYSSENIENCTDNTQKNFHFSINHNKNKYQNVLNKLQRPKEKYDEYSNLNNYKRKKIILSKYTSDYTDDEKKEDDTKKINNNAEFPNFVNNKYYISTSKELDEDCSIHHDYIRTYANKIASIRNRKELADAANDDFYMNCKNNLVDNYKYQFATYHKPFQYNTKISDRIKQRRLFGNKSNICPICHKKKAVISELENNGQFNEKKEENCSSIFKERLIKSSINADDLENAYNKIHKNLYTTQNALPNYKYVNSHYYPTYTSSINTYRSLQEYLTLNQKNDQNYLLEHNKPDFRSSGLSSNRSSERINYKKNTNNELSPKYKFQQATHDIVNILPKEQKPLMAAYMHNIKPKVTKNFNQVNQHNRLKKSYNSTNIDNRPPYTIEHVESYNEIPNNIEPSLITIPSKYKKLLNKNKSYFNTIDANDDTESIQSICAENNLLQPPSENQLSTQEHKLINLLKKINAQQSLLITKLKEIEEEKKCIQNKNKPKEISKHNSKKQSKKVFKTTGTSPINILSMSHHRIESKENSDSNLSTENILKTNKKIRKIRRSTNAETITFRTKDTQVTPKRFIETQHTEKPCKIVIQIENPNSKINRDDISNNNKNILQNISSLSPKRIINNYTQTSEDFQKPSNTSTKQTPTPDKKLLYKDILSKNQPQINDKIFCANSQCELCQNKRLMSMYIINYIKKMITKSQKDINEIKNLPSSSSSSSEYSCKSKKAAISSTIQKLQRNVSLQTNMSLNSLKINKKEDETQNKFNETSTINETYNNLLTKYREVTNNCSDKINTLSSMINAVRSEKKLLSNLSLYHKITSPVIKNTNTVSQEGKDVGTTLIPTRDETISDVQNLNSKSISEVKENKLEKNENLIEDEFEKNIQSLKRADKLLKTKKSEISEIKYYITEKVQNNSIPSKEDISKTFSKENINYENIIFKRLKSNDNKSSNKSTKSSSEVDSCSSKTSKKQINLPQKEKIIKLNSSPKQTSILKSSIQKVYNKSGATSSTQSKKNTYQSSHLQHKTSPSQRNKNKVQHPKTAPEIQTNKTLSSTKSKIISPEKHITRSNKITLQKKFPKQPSSYPNVSKNVLLQKTKSFLEKTEKKVIPTSSKEKKNASPKLCKKITINKNSTAKKVKKNLPSCSKVNKNILLKKAKSSPEKKVKQNSATSLSENNSVPSKSGKESSNELNSKKSKTDDEISTEPPENLTTIQTNVDNTESSTILTKKLLLEHNKLFTPLKKESVLKFTLERFLNEKETSTTNTACDNLSMKISAPTASPMDIENLALSNFLLKTKRQTSALTYTPHIGNKVITPRVLSTIFETETPSNLLQISNKSIINEDKNIANDSSSSSFKTSINSQSPNLKSKSLFNVHPESNSKINNVKRSKSENTSKIDKITKRIFQETEQLLEQQTSSNEDFNLEYTFLSSLSLKSAKSSESTDNIKTSELDESSSDVSSNTPASLETFLKNIKFEKITTDRK